MEYLSKTALRLSTILHFNGCGGLWKYSLPLRSFFKHSKCPPNISAIFLKLKSPVLRKISETTSHGAVNTSINPSCHRFTQRSIANFYSWAFKIRLPWILSRNDILVHCEQLKNTLMKIRLLWVSQSMIDVQLAHAEWVCNRGHCL